MAIAEIFLSAFITVLSEKLASGELLKLPSINGVDDKIKKWSKDLKIIKAVLNDAEEKQITDTSVQQWLEELQDLAYDMDDMLDELNTELSLCKEPDQSSSKVRKLIPSCCTTFTPSAFMLDARASRKIDEITVRLDALMKQNHDFGLTKSGGGMPDTVGQGSRATTSVVEESLVLGRAEEKAAICKLLLEERKRNHDGEGRDVFVIPILGMGGLGKTTLAQLVYNDEQVEGHFDHRAWVCVSDDFDLLRVSNLIYDSVAESSGEFKDLNSVQVRLKAKLSNKKFLVVLDDVWDESYAKWDQFRVPFLVGAPESAIVVTTRIGKIAQFMGSMEAYALKPLPDNECVSLLTWHALSRPNFDTRPDLKETGEEIAMKCGGLPLAAKSIGGVLRTKTSLKQWKNVLTSKIWDLGSQSNDVLPALRLSYHHLPPHLKPLFVYCSIFPKDYEFQKDDLILLWMAEGLLTRTGENMPMEELGFEYFNELLSRSFFGEAKSRNDEEPRFLMHDLINDLALFVAGKVCCRLDEKMESKVQSSFSEKVRHSSFIRQKYGTYRMFMPYSGCLHLRTFLPIAVGNLGDFYLSNTVLNELLPKLRCLRVLSLSGYRVNELPRSIGDSKHLRYLNMSYTDITQLPESVCELYNLQTLLLRSCDKLNQLPKGIQKLTNLRHLDIARTQELKWIPYGIGTLSSLCTLSKVVIGKRNGFQLSELKGLSNLIGTLLMVGMQNIGSVKEAREANLMGKGGLDKLEMRWDGNFEDCRDEGIESQVLDVLKPQPGLKWLKIAYYSGTSFPSWVGDPSFSSMVHLTLSGCKNCTSLPSLGHLHALRELFIIGMDRVKAVGAEFYGDGSPAVGAFPSLEILGFEQMISWEEWSSNFISGEENVKAVFPRLGKLTMVGCRRLVKVCLPRIPSLGVLTIKESSEALLRSMVGIASVETLKIRAIEGLTQLDEGIINSFGALEHLRISQCSKLRYLWQEEIVCVILTKLSVLEIKYCGQLISLGEKEQVLPHNLRRMKLTGCDSLEKIPNWCESLKVLEIQNCKKLKYFPSAKKLVPKTEKNGAIATSESSSSNDDQMEGFHNLETLDISNCPCLTSLPTGKKLPSTLKRLDIFECEKLEEPEEVDSKEKAWLLNSMSSLESIYINRWVNLKPFRERCFFRFIHLTEVLILRCEGIDSIPERCLPPALTFLRICYCKNLKSLLFRGDDLECLQHLEITGCNNLECYPNGCWPPNLKTLKMGDVKQLITEWGLHLHSLPTSLTHLKLWGMFPELVSLSDVGSHLPNSLTRLHIQGLVNLKSLSDGLQYLTSLEQLSIFNCPKIRSLPDMLLPALSNLEIFGCPLMKERCGKDKRDYWARIAHIPCVEIDGELLWGL